MKLSEILGWPEKKEACLGDENNYPYSLIYQKNHGFNTALVLRPRD